MAGSSLLKGSLLVTASSGLQRLLGLATQVILGFLLGPEDYGLYASVVLFGTLMASARGVFRPIGIVLAGSDSATQESLGPLKLLGWVLGLAAILFGALAVGEELERTIVFVLAAFSVPVQFALLAPSAKVAADRQYRTLASSTALGAMARSGVSVGLAALGLGATSLAGGALADSGAELVSVKRAARGIDLARLQEVSSKLVPNKSVIVVGTAAMTVGATGDYAVLALLAPVSVTGLYFFAYQFSSAFIRPFTGVLLNVLVPGFMADGDGEKKTDLLPVLRAMCVVGSVLGISVALAGPELIGAVWGDRWRGASIAVFVLSLALPFRLMLTPVLAALTAIGLWGPYTKVLIARALLLIVAVGAVGSTEDLTLISSAVFGAHFLTLGICLLIARQHLQLAGRSLAWIALVATVTPVALALLRVAQVANSAVVAVAVAGVAAQVVWLLRNR